MTRQKSLWRLTLESYPCSSCGAAPEKPCRSAYGARKPVATPHVARSNQAAQNGWKPNPALLPPADTEGAAYIITTATPPRGDTR